MTSNPLHAKFAALAVRVAADRDKSAFTELFDHFAPRVTAYLLRLGLSKMEAEEVAQEVMIVLWHKAHLFDPKKSSMGTWLFRVARNRRIDLHRRDRSALLDPHDPIFQPSGEAPADEEMDANLRDERVRRALSVLKEDQLELINQAFFMGKTHSAIAEETGIALGTVKSRIRLAFKKLREELERDPQVDTDD